MAKPKRVTRKQLLKEPDEFMTTTGRIVRWGQQYARQLAFAAGAFLLLIVVISAYRYYTNWTENKAFLLLDEAVSKYETQKAKTDAIDAYKDTREDFETIIRKYDHTDGGQMAMVVFAGMSYEAGDADRAIQLYEAGLNFFDADTAYQNFILSSLGYAYEKMRDIQKAVSCFEKIADGLDPTVRDIALFNLGRLYQELGDSAKSKAAYERLISNHTESIYYQLAKEKVSG